MKPLLAVLGAVLVWPAACGWAEEGASAGALTLEEGYRLALKRSEEIAIHQELINETEGRFMQALGTALPRASFSLSEKRQDGSGGSSFTLKEVPERKFVFTQPLFAGFKEFAAMGASRAEHRQRQFEYSKAELTLMVDVSDAFYLLLEQRQDREALETVREALRARLKELEERARLGRSRASELASAEAKLRRVEADIEEAKRDEATGEHLLAFLTGLPRIGALQDAPDNTLMLSPEEAYLAKVDQRPDVHATEQAWRVAEQQVTIARAKFFPTVDAEAHYYTTRVGAASGVDWDAILTVDVPIFQGGEALGATTEAAAKAREAKLRYEEAQRAASLDIRDAYVKAATGLLRVQMLEQALQASEESYRLQTEDYRMSLVSNLDVLQELEALEGVRRARIAASYEAKRFYWVLQAAIGERL